MVESSASNVVSPVLDVNFENPGHLEPNQVVRILVKRDEASVFYYGTISERSNLTIELWDPVEEGNSYVIMKVAKEYSKNDIEKENDYENSKNSNKIVINEKYMMGNHRLVVQLPPSDPDMSRVKCLRLRHTPVSSVTSLDNLDAPYEATIGDDALFFTYSVESVEELENHLLLLNVSNRTKLQVYVHLHPFPDEKNHHYPLGDVPDYALKALFKASLKMEIFEDSSPYIYDKV